MQRRHEWLSLTCLIVSNWWVGAIGRVAVGIRVALAERQQAVTVGCGRVDKVGVGIGRHCLQLLCAARRISTAGRQRRKGQACRSVAAGGGGSSGERQAGAAPGALGCCMQCSLLPRPRWFWRRAAEGQHGVRLLPASPHSKVRALMVIHTIDRGQSMDKAVSRLPTSSAGQPRQQGSFGPTAGECAARQTI